MVGRIYKSIILALFSLCFLTAGMLTMQSSNYSYAVTEVVDSVDTETPDYFSAVELSTSGDQVSGSLLDSNIFMYSANASNNSNSVQLSLLTNGASVNPGSAEIYQYVYYPNASNLSVFYFYQITNTNLYINGVQQTSIPENIGINHHTGISFENYDSALELETYELIFTNATNRTEDTNVINLVDEQGNLIEGRYTVEIEMVLFTCSDGTNDATEDSFSSNAVTISYEFMVLEESDYIMNSRPIINHANFDNAVDIPTSTSTVTGNYLFSNYSAYDTSDLNNEKYGSIASLTYDASKYDVAISKELTSSTEAVSLSYIAENDTGSNDGMTVEGADIVDYVKSVGNSNVTLYFSEIGNYTITFSAVATFEYTDPEDQTTTINNKYNLSALSQRIRNVMVFVYGYQATHVDYDGELNASGNRTYTEFKTIDTNADGSLTGAYSESADITAKFLNSNTVDFGQNQSTTDVIGDTTFLISNVTNFINNTELNPQVTNQAPVRFNSNATMRTGTGGSLIYSTTQVNSSYTQTSQSITLDGNEMTLYRANYTGGSINTNGTYILILAYTFENYYYSGTPASNVVFYQVFYFQITGDSPEVALTTIGEDSETVFTDRYYNKNVLITDNNSVNSHNKNVTVQIYAYDYTQDIYLSKYGGRNGIAMGELTSGNTYELTENAHFTIKLYYSYEIPSSTDIDSTSSRIKRTYYFTIDKQEIENVTANNVSLVSNSSSYSVVSELTRISTNQNIAVSWEEKNSGASTFAYYRYFPIYQSTFYPEDQELTSDILRSLLNLNSDLGSFLAVNYTLDLTTDNNNWLRYYGNTLNLSRIASNYVLSSAGLYLFDVYDAAGNHKVEIFIIDNSTPTFALYTQSTSTYSLITSSYYISETSTLYWGNYKAIQISNFDSFRFDSITGVDDVELADIEPYNLYYNYNNTESIDIFSAIYDLFLDRNVQYLNYPTSEDPYYNGAFLTIELEDIFYQTDINSSNDNYVMQSGATYITLNADDNEYTYRILIRDRSNTRYDAGSINNPNASIHYTAYFSAMQTIIVSHDTSEFRLYYELDNGELNYLSSNNMVEGTDENDNSSLTTYLSPINVNKTIYLSYIPTVTDEYTVQIESVTMTYYQYEEKTVTENGITYHYYGLAETPTTSDVLLYSFEDDGPNSSAVVQTFMLNTDDITSAGKYEITRTYSLDDSFSYNDKDYVTRTFVLYVDRNEVISSPVQVNDDAGSHSESLVGGEIYVAMHDSGTDASLVITYPNSVEGNTDSATLYNSTNSLDSILTTNKLPVNIYVPMYKYTTNATLDTNENNIYDFSVNEDTTSNTYRTDNYIQEYLMFADIYLDYENEGSTPLYRSTSKFSNPTSENITYDEETGFLEFYAQNSNTPIQSLTTEGVYTVIIYQGFSSAGTSETTFRKYAMFTFTIENTSPDFLARTTQGASLTSRTVNGIETYYTNQDTIEILWQIARDEYTAEIDQDEMYVAYNGRPATATNANSLFNGAITTAGNYYIGTLNIRTLQQYANGNYIDITMQFQNYTYYTNGQVTKRIYIDLEAPNTNIDNLVSQTISNTYSTSLITEDSLRVHYDINKNVVSSANSTCYNVSTSSGTFRYYSFAVSSDYVTTLRNTSTDEAPSIYYRVMNNKYASSNDQETDPYNFLETANFNLVDATTSFNSGTYYEIVETDLAGNLTIYTIYILDYNPVTIEEGINDGANNIVSYTTENGNDSFTREDYQEVQSVTNHSPLLSIYSPTGMTITDLNYFGYNWIPFTVQAVTDGNLLGTTYYLASPWLLEGYVYRVNGNTFTEVNINTIIDGSLDTTRKNVITVYDSLQGGTTNFYINTRNIDFRPNASTEQNREYISFNQPTTAQLEDRTTATTYLTSIRIYTPSTQTGGTTTETVYYEATNNLGYSDRWASSSNVTISTSGSNIIFELNPNLNLEVDTRIIYEYTDNYGKSYTEIHLFNETTGYDEISTSDGGILYSFYYTLNGENNLYYITNNNFRYTYNENKYSLLNYQYNGTTWQALNDQFDPDSWYVTITSESYSTDTSVIANTYSVNTLSNTYNYFFRIDVQDVSSGEFVKSVYFILNNEIPTVATSTENLYNNFYLASNGVNVTNSLLGLDGETQVNYFSNVTLYYDITTSFLPVKLYISTDRQNWAELANGEQIVCEDDQEQVVYYLKIWYDLDAIRELGYYNRETVGYEYIFEYVPSGNIYEFTLSSTLATAYYVMLLDEDGNGTVVERTGQSYTNRKTNQIYSNHYIVNIDEAYRKQYLRIVTNSEQYITWKEIDEIPDEENTENPVMTYIYHISNVDYINSNKLTNVPRFDTLIAITFIEPTDEIVQTFNTYDSSGRINTGTNLIYSSSYDLVVTESNISRIELRWSKYYAIEQNTINIIITKNGYSLSPTIYTRTDGENEYYYTYLTRSGRYRISFEDASGNIQMFNKGSTSQSTTFTLTFLKDIPFTITYTNPLTEESETTEPINQAVYNGSVTLTADTQVSSYYTGTGITMTITRNGEEYATVNNMSTYTLSTTGYYGVTLTATSSANNESIRSETYYFTILNANAYKYSYIINKYSNYYIERVIKDGVDVTNDFLMETDFSTIMVNQQEYLAELNISYLDERTGTGTYYITVNSNERMYSSDSTQTSWTFKVIIQMGSADLIYATENGNIMSPGDATTAVITITFNRDNIFAEYGECEFRIIYYDENNTMHYYTDTNGNAVRYAINSESTGITSVDINNDNTQGEVTYFLQLVDPDGNLVYSMKIIRSKAMNAATIIIIVVAVVIVLVVLILIFKLRKRISVK